MSAKSKTRDRWAFLCRSGVEDQVVEELGATAEVLAEGVVGVEARPRDIHHALLVPLFATQAMRTSGQFHATDPERIADAVAAELGRLREGPWTLSVAAPSSRRPRDPRRRVADAIDERIGALLDRRIARSVAERFVAEPADASALAQVWVVDPDRALVGVTRVEEVIAREVVEPDDEGLRARSGRKLEEALEWLGIGPDRGETCVDLGSGPGAWTAVLAARGAKVLAVDRARLSVSIDDDWKVEPVHASPFVYAPDETADWLTVHLSARPQEVSQLVAKWGRRAWARQVVAKLLLPMKQKVAVVRDVLAELEAAGWRGLKARQLPSDGEEITVYGWLDPKLALRGPRAPFRLRSEGAERARAEREEEAPARASMGEVRAAWGRGAGGAGRARPAAEGARTRPAAEGARTRPAAEGARTRPDRSAARARPERDGARTRPDRSAARARPERDGARARPERDGARTRPDRSAARARPERDGARTRPERSAARTRPERDGTRMRPERDGPDRSAARARPERDGARARPDRSAARARPERDGARARPDRDAARTRPDRSAARARPERDAARHAPTRTRQDHEPAARLDGKPLWASMAARRAPPTPGGRAPHDGSPTRARPGGGRRGPPRRPR